MRPQISCFLSLAVWLVAGSALAQDLKVAGFNVESGGSDPDVVADMIAEAQGVDLWGFSEVQNDSWAEIFETAAEVDEGADFERIVGTTGGGDRLAIIFDASRLELMESFELHDINPGGRVRAPLVAHFRIRDNGLELLFMVNHLYRSKANLRHQQSTQLNAWAQAQALPVIAVGDYNFDWDLPDGDSSHDAGYDLLTADGAFVWVRPPDLIRTQCSDFNSVLDFVFVSGPARNWGSSALIHPMEPDYCPDDNATSDHRMVLADFSFVSVAEADARSRIMERLDAIERELRELRTLVEQLP